MKKFPKVSVVVLNYNNKDTILDCLKSVYQSDYPDFDVIVVDNDSKDGSLELVKQNFLTAKIIKNSANVGFSSGNNIGIRYALEKFADYVFLLNSDAFLKNDSLSFLVNEAETEKCSIACPVIFSEGNKIWYAGGKIDWLRMRTVHNNIIKSKEPYKTEIATGCAMLISKEVFKQIGLLSEKYFLYYEDADFSINARRKGFAIKVVPMSIVNHLEKSENNPSLKIYWLVLSGLIFFKRNTPLFFKPTLLIIIFMRKLKNLYNLKFNKTDFAESVRKAYFDFKKIK